MHDHFKVSVFRLSLYRDLKRFLSVTFHRAVDMAADGIQGMNYHCASCISSMGCIPALTAIGSIPGIQRILTRQGFVLVMTETKK
jgi:copper homeostasis protein CutC